MSAIPAADAEGDKPRPESRARAVEADAHIVRRDTKVSRDVFDRCALEIDSTQHVGMGLPKLR